MNKKLSGGQLVLVKITQKGFNPMPYVENIAPRVIKYIDFHASAYLPEVTYTGVTSTAGLYLTLTRPNGSVQFVRDMPLERFDYVATLGIRQKIGSAISMRDSGIVCTDASQIGKYAALVFWYDLPEYSERNTTKSLTTDSVTVTLISDTRYNQLPDLERLISRRFRRILVAAPSTTPDFKTGVTAAQLPNLYLTLRRGSYNVLENIPMSMLVQLQQLEKCEIANIIFDMQSSFITIGGAGTIPNVATDYVGKSVFFNLEYENK